MLFQQSVEKHPSDAQDRANRKTRLRCDGLVRPAICPSGHWCYGDVSPATLVVIERPVLDCWYVALSIAALGGERAPVGARFASELGKGRVLFVAGKLDSFSPFTDSPYPAAVSEMTKRFRVSGKAYTRGEGATRVSGMRWKVGGSTVLVFKLPNRDGAFIYVGHAENPVTKSDVSTQNPSQ